MSHAAPLTPDAEDGAEAAAAYEQAERCAPGNREFSVKRQLAQSFGRKAPRPRARPEIVTTSGAARD